MRKSRAFLTILLLTLVFQVVSRGGEYPHDKMLNDLETLGEQLTSDWARKRPELWRDRAQVMFKRMRWALLIENSNIPIRITEKGDHLISTMRYWCEGEGDPLPEPENYYRWLEELSSLLQQAQPLSASPPARPHRQWAQRELRFLLGQPRYSHMAEKSQGLNERIAEFVSRYVIQPLFGRQRRSVRRIGLIICIALLVLIGIHMIWETVRALYQTSKEKKKQTEDVPTESVALRRAAPGELLSRGDKARESGQYLRAAGLYYLTLLSILAREGCTALDRTLTNWEHYLRARRSGCLAESEIQKLERVNTFFDRCCYGGEKISDNQIDNFRKQIIELSNAI
ncbi:MAG: hypothetical protein ACLFWL_07850 [Candidatus Brocadiia bacterium]